MGDHGKLRFEYNKINEFIFIGSNMCCHVHFKSELLKKGIKADISLEKENLDSPRGVKYYLWIPVTDHTAPSQEQLELGSKFLENLVKKKIRTYVHCLRGHSRSATLVAAYFVRQRMSVGEAIAYVKRRRPVIHPNKKQVAALEKFAKRFKGR